MDYLKILIDFGLSERETLVYTALLELEIANVKEITLKTNLNRSSIYVVLTSLQNRGLVTIASTISTTKYIASSPDQLLRLAKENVEKYTLLKQNLHALLPELKKMHKGSIFKPKITIYEGDAGITRSFEDTLTATEKVIRICSSATYPIKTMTEFFISYLHKRKERGIKMRGIHPNNEMVKQMVKHAPKNFDEMNLIPEEKFKFPSDIAIWDNNIGFMSTKEAFGVKIESKDMCDTLKTLFDLAYEESKRLSKTLK